MPKVYVAGKFEEAPLIRDIQELFCRRGWTITCDWTVDKPTEELDKLKSCAQRDYEGVETADLLVFFAANKLPYRGAFVELGIALGKNIPTAIIGHGIDSCIFCNLPDVVKFDTVAQLMESKYLEAFEYVEKRFADIGKEVVRQEDFAHAPEVTRLCYGRCFSELQENARRMQRSEDQSERIFGGYISLLAFIKGRSYGEPYPQRSKAKKRVH